MDWGWKEFAQIGGGIVAYSLLTQTFNFVLRFKDNGKADFVVECLKEIKHKLDHIDHGITKLGRGET